MLDFRLLQNGNPVNDSYKPREIFQALPKKEEQFQYPRDVQADVWESWYEKRNQKDNLIKMNTGSGKTTVGLLILKSCLNEKFGPAVYIAPDNYLVHQVKKEADRLGIVTTTNPEDVLFLSGQAILVTNVHKVFNGKSCFGVYPNIKQEIGSIVIDDAHACLDIIENQFTIKIPKASSLYEEFYSLFKESLKQQNEVRLQEIEICEPNAFIHLPFWTWKDKQSEIIKFLVNNKNEDFLKFALPLLTETLEFCNCVFCSEYIEISPFHIPTEAIPAYSNAKRRIFMTATLSDNGILSTHFGVNPNIINNQITPKLASDVGERMILFPQAITPDITDLDIKNSCIALAEKHNVVIIVPSKSRASFWQDAAKVILSAENLQDNIQKLKNEHVGLVVLVNRYDGVDLPHSACRILVIDSLPNTNSYIDKVNQSILLSNELTVTNHIQKIEQGMGRGIRANNDYCVVILMGAQLINAIYNMNGIQNFSPATQAQIKLSESVAKQLSGKSMDEILTNMDYCLQRDPEWISAHQSHISNLIYLEQKIGINVKLYESFLLAKEHNYSKAITNIQDLVNEHNNNAIVQGYLKQVLATYTYFIDQVEAHKIQLNACSLNQRLLKPLQGFNYKMLDKPARSQAETCHLYISKYNDRIGEFTIKLNSILDHLKFMPNSANKFENAIYELGLIMGFGSQRPENDYKVGPDNLWSLSSNKYVVIECKNEATADTISKHYCNQLNGSENWFVRNYHNAEYGLLLIHPSIVFENAASPSNKMRIMNIGKLEELTTNIRSMFTGLVEQGSIFNIEQIRQNLLHYHLDSDSFVYNYSIAVN